VHLKAECEIGDSAILLYFYDQTVDTTSKLDNKEVMKDCIKLGYNTAAPITLSEQW
jgi:hypothetical protein